MNKVSDKDDRSDKKDNSKDKVKIKQVTQNLINLSIHTLRTYNRSTRKGEEVFVNILLSDDNDIDDKDVLV